MRIRWILWALATGLLFCQTAAAQKPSAPGVLVDQRTQWVAVITDTTVIKTLASAFYIIEDTLTSMEVIDINNNGFSRGDLIRVFPSEEIYFLDAPGEAIQSLMDGWTFQPNFHVTIENSQTPEMLEELPQRQAEYGIVSGFLRGLRRNYRDWPLKAWIQRDTSGLSFQMWGYTDSLLLYQPPPPSGYDLMEIRTLVRDTLFIPAEEP